MSEANGEDVAPAWQNAQKALEKLKEKSGNHVDQVTLPVLHTVM